ncbi:ribonuclease H [Alphaproteobacteria bacterium]|nr:ribonuclease H [Alphaproteobacteria bacterium]
MIEYFTDGSASPNPGPGGFAVIKNGQPYLVGGEKDSTNIRMEGLALLAALEDADGAECEIRTDSEFWINVLTQWAPNWKRNGWHKKGGIKNIDIVQKLYKVFVESNAKLIWVRGHVGTELNELADEWANKARKMHTREPVLVSAAK